MSTTTTGNPSSRTDLDEDQSRSREFADNWTRSGKAASASASAQIAHGDADMVQIIEQLGRDHRNLRLLLDIVEEETNAYREGRTPDFDLLRLIAEYTLHY